MPAEDAGAPAVVPATAADSTPRGLPVLPLLEDVAAALDMGPLPLVDAADVDVELDVAAAATALAPVSRRPTPPAPKSALGRRGALPLPFPVPAPVGLPPRATAVSLTENMEEVEVKEEEKPPRAVTTFPAP